MPSSFLFRDVHVLDDGTGDTRISCGSNGSPLDSANSRTKFLFHEGDAVFLTELDGDEMADNRERLLAAQKLSSSDRQSADDMADSLRRAEGSCNLPYADGPADQLDDANDLELLAHDVDVSSVSISDVVVSSTMNGDARAHGLIPTRPKLPPLGTYRKVRRAGIPEPLKAVNTTFEDSISNVVLLIYAGWTMI
jgi:hypothetical protein